MPRIHTDACQFKDACTGHLCCGTHSWRSVADESARLARLVDVDVEILLEMNYD